MPNERGPTFWERIGQHPTAYRFCVIVVATALPLAAFWAATRLPAGAGLAFLVVLASTWIGLLGVVDRAEGARERRYKGMHRLRDFAQRLAIYDRETGLYADWYFRLRLEEELARSRRFGQQCALLLVEAVFGRLRRERERELFEGVATAFRGTDLVAHLGSLRFAVLLTNTGREGAIIARNRLVKSVPHVEVGLACYPDDGDDWRSLLAAAGGQSSGLQAETLRDWEAQPATGLGRRAA